MNSKKILPTLAGALLLALFVAPASAQWREAPAKPGSAALDQGDVKGAGRWSELRLVIKDVNSGEEIGTIEPEGRVRLREGAKVRLIMSAYVPGNDKPIYPETVYSEAQKGRGGVQITKSSRENANVTLQLTNIPERYGHRAERVSYEILDPRVPSRLQRGSFVIDVLSNESANSAPGTAGGRPVTYPIERPAVDVRTRAGRMTQVLYRAILMREPDSGAQGFTDRIERDGYEGVIRAAVLIAESNESRRDIYEQKPDLTPEQRLSALYRELLGMRDGEYDRRTWDEDLRRIRDGRIATVVDEMVRSQRFRELYSY